MSGVWDGNHPADFIGRRLSDPWFPFGVGVPFAAAKGMCDYLDVAASDPGVVAACVAATGDVSLTPDVIDALAAFVRHVRQEASR